jgi:hypothetical protein
MSASATNSDLDTTKESICDYCKTHASSPTTPEPKVDASAKPEEPLRKHCKTCGRIVKCSKCPSNYSGAQHCAACGRNRFPAAPCLSCDPKRFWASKRYWSILNYKKHKTFAARIAAIVFVILMTLILVGVRSEAFYSSSVLHRKDIDCESSEDAYALPMEFGSVAGMLARWIVYVVMISVVCVIAMTSYEVVIDQQTRSHPTALMMAKRKAEKYRVPVS